ncbi:MAG TPA: SCO family protein [Fibrobacteria bacterium]|nr:SCO family protein [Fibrobacteria bacterium]
MIAFNPSLRIFLVLLAASAAWFCRDASAFGGSYGSQTETVVGADGQSLPANLVDVGIEEHLGEQIPLDARFKDETGKEVEIGAYFRAGRPVLLNFAYFQCPMLCNMVLGGMLEGMKKLDWTPGKEYEIVTISIDPREGPELAAAKKQTHIEALGRPEAAAGWHFLTGSDKDIRKVADAIGFKYQYVKTSNEYAHAAGVFTLSPAAKISRYLYGVEFKKKDLRLALLDASEGKALSIGDKLVMFCYRYDANAKGYVLFARNFMKGSGVAVVAGLALLLGALWRKEFKRRDVARRPVATGSGA